MFFFSCGRGLMHYKNEFLNLSLIIICPHFLLRSIGMNFYPFLEVITASHPDGMSWFSLEGG